MALLPLADRTDHTWANWSGESPAALVARLLADSLQFRRGRAVTLIPATEVGAGLAVTDRVVDDDQALLAARRVKAEVAVTGTVNVMTHEDRRDPGRLFRWGVGAPDARSRVEVSVTLRAIDTSDGSVMIETTASRERVGRGTASIGRAGEAPALDPLVEQALRDVLGDLMRTLGQRLDAHWQARVVHQGRETFVLDAGLSRGLFAGQRLDVWRSGIGIFDENVARIGDDERVGAVVVVALEGRTRARARLVEGEAHAGDLVRPCSQGAEPTLSLRR